MVQDCITRMVWRGLRAAACSIVTCLISWAIGTLYMKFVQGHHGVELGDRSDHEREDDQEEEVRVDNLGDAGDDGQAATDCAVVKD